MNTLRENGLEGMLDGSKELAAATIAANPFEPVQRPEKPVSVHVAKTRPARAPVFAPLPRPYWRG